MIEEAIRLERSVVWESPLELSLTVVAAAAFTVRDTTAAKLQAKITTFDFITKDEKYLLITWL